MLDTKLILKAAGLVAASANGTGIEVGEGKFNARMVIDVSVIEIATGDEKYVLHLVGGDDSDFTNSTSLGSIEVGGATSGIEGNVDSTPGRFEIPVSNVKAGVIYPHVRLRTVISGTIATGINFSAYLSER
jgi:hypothetical protein